MLVYEPGTLLQPLVGRIECNSADHQRKARLPSSDAALSASQAADRQCCSFDIDDGGLLSSSEMSTQTHR